MKHSTIYAKYRRPQAPHAISKIVIHDMEAPERATIAEDVARYFQTTTRPASVHECVDVDSYVTTADDMDSVAAAPGANHDSIHIEQPGYARQIRSEWLDVYGVQMINNCAERVAYFCKKYGVPVRWLSVEEVAAGKRGICDHDAISKAYKRGTHWDCGPHYPVDVFMAQVTAHFNGTATVIKPVYKTRVLKRPMQNDGGNDVTILQRELNKVAQTKIAVDGDFGPKTENLVLAFQRAAKIEVDGIAGPDTRRNLTLWIKDGKTLGIKVGPIKIKPRPGIPDFPGLLKRGAHGADVRRLQQRLTDHKSPSLTIDGNFGPKTESSVKWFQRARRLTVDGLVGPKTWKSLWR
jgi:hypothetical protein